MSERRLNEIVDRCEALYLDLRFEQARRWKEAEPGRHVVAYLPVYAPAEVVTAAGMLPLGVVGGGDQLEIIRGDAFFQSYICHIPRSVVELGLSGRLDFCDGFLFPSTCDVIRNLSGIWQLEFPDKYVRYVDVPQDFRAEGGGRWWHHELGVLRDDLAKMAGRPVTDEDLRRAIRLHDENRALVRDLYDLRSEEPWKAPTSEVYLVQRAGLLLPVEEHSALVRDYLDAARSSDRPMRDHSRVVITGSFCEQPPLDLLRTLERAGCYIVDDDLLLGPRFLQGDVAPAPD
jgi:benzoyl-CoA reductase subunit C